MTRKFATALLLSAAPAVLPAQEVELRSADGFISVEGEIVDFNGVMLSVRTSVGIVGVPVSEVACYGPGCIEVLASNTFSLTEDAFVDVFAEDPSAVVEVLDDNLTIALSSSAYESVFATLAGVYAVARDTSTAVEVNGDGVVSLRNEGGNETATLTATPDTTAGDIVVGPVAMTAAETVAFGNPESWATATQLTHQLLGFSAMSVVTAPDVAVSSISIADLAAVYAGEISNWSELGGPDLKILPLQLPAESQLRDEIITVVMNPHGKTISPDVLTMADEASITGSIGNFPGSISIVSLSAAEGRKALPIAGSCGRPVAANTFNVVSGDYPLISPVMANYDAVPQTGLVVDLFDFAPTKIAQGMLERGRLVNLSAIRQETTTKNDRLSQIIGAELDEVERPVGAQMFQLLFEADRLSPTLIGGAVSGPEGGWNRAMFRNLADALKSGTYAGKELMFVGFSDESEGALAAIDRSVASAAAVQDAFAQYAPDIITANSMKLASFGFGAVAPAACVSGQVPDVPHSRVEIWVR